MNEIKKVVTHDGLFHADEVFAVAWLRHAFKISHHTPIIRTRDKAVLQEALADPHTIVIDVGGVYDPSMNNFDHHQDGSLPSSNILVAQHFDMQGRETQEASDEVMKSIMQGVSDWDTNRGDIVNRLGIDFPGIKTISHLVSSFNNDPRDAEIQDEFFTMAVGFALIIMNNAFADANSKILARKLYNDHNLTCNGIPVWKEFCATWKEGGQFMFAIQPNPQGWALLSANSTTHPLPTAEEIKAVAPGLIFLHAGRFIAVFATLEEAVAVAEGLL